MSRMVRRPDGKLDGSLRAVGNLPTFMEEIVDNGLPFPASKFAGSSGAA
jgi:pilus assembly protein CpaF